ncbi:class I SAM-dependent methyltransferase [Rhodovulum imhoffii]|nr:class I SAM-dependent methyltransferase [Rhodovulum imhoffii]
MFREAKMKSFRTVMREYRFQGDSITDDLKEKYRYEGDLGRLYAEHDGPLIQKWHHYLPVYEKYLSRYRGTGFRFLEIGVSGGGSLHLWRHYFGDDATIMGIDINPDCQALDGQSGMVRIGSQDDEAFLNRVVEEMGGVDVILDDGSHRMEHVSKSLQVLFPKLSTPGLYLVEDLHTAYWPKYGGGLDAPTNFFNIVKPLADDMHAWLHEGPAKVPGIGNAITGIHLYDSMLILEKDEVHPPAHSRIRGG